jgi:hypothetical protein
MIYRVILQRAVSEEAAIEIEAGSPEEAEDTARTRESDGMVAWVKTHEEVEALACPT